MDSPGGMTNVEGMFLVKSAGLLEIVNLRPSSV